MEKIPIYFKKSDFDVLGKDFASNYSEPKDCPLVRAFHRHFPEYKKGDISVCDDIHTWHKHTIGYTTLYEFGGRKEWSSTIAEKVGECLHNEDGYEYFLYIWKV